jgi:hypothetical protein
MMEAEVILSKPDSFSVNFSWFEFHFKFCVWPSARVMQAPRDHPAKHTHLACILVLK